jgi:hypothetical protein
MEPQHYLDECVFSSDEEPLRTHFFRAWHINAGGNRFGGEAPTPAGARAALREDLEQHGIIFSSLLLAIKRSIHL